MSEWVVTKKGYKYRDNLLKHIKKIGAYPNHPVNQGVHMEAHHLISEESLKKAKMQPILKSRGYNINVVENLVLIPSTPAGACHLGVQLHRGDHVYGIDDAGDDDECHP